MARCDPISLMIMYEFYILCTNGRHDKLEKSAGMAARKPTMKKMTRYLKSSQRLGLTQLPTLSRMTIPATEDYRTGRYGDLDRILYKVNFLRFKGILTKFYNGVSVIYLLLLLLLLFVIYYVQLILLFICIILVSSLHMYTWHLN